ncbi:MAG: hypothetical protein KBD65_02930 [Candidatus Moranbacteria bacterium]|nr:hypothetical protein [Candidatus Moranbacteria bacterium]
MSFLPQEGRAPKENGGYLKLIEGSIKFRVVSDAVFGYEYWNNEKKPVRLHEQPRTKPADIRTEEDGSYSVKHFWAFKVLDRNDGMVKIFEITQNGIKRDIEALLDNSDWGNPTGYDITIVGTGKGMERRYTVQPSPHKPLTEEETKQVARTEVDLEALFSGTEPFKKETPEENIPVVGKSTDVPF